MKLASLLHKIDALQQAIDAKGPLDETIKKRIQYKFRLDWNYYSNAMEGNSLTKQETRSVMMNNITINGKPMRDVLEIKGHDEAVLDILKISKAEVRLSERRIKELHKAIIYEEDPEKAQQVGEWKTQANYLLNVRNERFDFLEPELVPDAMHQLLDKTNAQIDAYYHAKKEGWHPAVIAFYFHLEYVKIHPFYDGNGRTARLLMNLLLVSFGLPPVVLNLENKERYYSLLTDIQGYGGNPDLFYEFMSELLIESQEMVLDAIDGKDISGEDDLDKELSILKRRLEGESFTKSPKNIYEVYQFITSNLWNPLDVTLKKFEEFFNESKIKRFVNYQDEIFPTKSLFPVFEHPFEKSTKPADVKIFGHDIYDTDVNEIKWEKQFYGLKKTKRNTEYKIYLSIDFHSNDYTLKLWMNYKEVFIKNYLYTNFPDLDTIQGVKKDLGSYLLTIIKNDTN